MGAALAVIGLIVQLYPVIVKGYELLAGKPAPAKAASIWDSIYKALELVGTALDLLQRARAEGRDVTNAERDAVIADSRALFAELDAELTEAAKLPG